MQPPCSLMMLQKENNKSSNLHHYKNHDAAFQVVYYVTKFAEDIYRLTLSRQTQSPSMFPRNNQILSNRVWVFRLQKHLPHPSNFLTDHQVLAHQYVIPSMTVLLTNLVPYKLDCPCRSSSSQLNSSLSSGQ